MKIRLVDGHKIRSRISPDFGVAASNYLSPYVPKGEIWLDKAYRKEKEWFVKMHRMELKLLKKMKYSDARKVICGAMLKTGKIPDFTIRLVKQGRIMIRQVDGRIVRPFLDPKFILGGHGYVYSYIPKSEVWIDNVQSRKEIKYTLIHELHEMKLMKKGMRYSSAHDYALAAEKEARRKDGAVYMDD